MLGPGEGPGELPGAGDTALIFKGPVGIIQARGHLAMSRDIFGCESRGFGGGVGEELLLAFRG